MYSFSKTQESTSKTSSKNSKQTPRSKDSNLHQTHDISGKSSSSKEMLSELTTYINSLSQEYSANFGIIHSNLVEFKLMLDNLFEISSSGLREVISSLPRKSAEALIEHKNSTKQIFSKIFKFLEKFLSSLNDFSSENVNFDRFSEIPDNSSSFHDIRDDDFEEELLSLKQENEVLKERVKQLEERLFKVNENCQGLIRELEIQKILTEKLKKLMEKIKNKEKKQENFEFSKIGKIFEKHLVDLSKKLIQKDEKIDDLENKYEDFEGVKKFNLSLQQDLQKITKEYENIRNVYLNSLKKIEKLEKFQGKGKFENFSDKSSFNDSRKSTEKSDNEPSSRIPKIKSSKTFAEDTCSNKRNELEQARNDVERLNKEVKELKETFRGISDVLGIEDEKEIMEKIYEIKQDYNSATHEVEILSETLEELEEYSKTTRGRLLNYVQNKDKIAQINCKRIADEFGAFFEKGLKKIDERLKKVEIKLKNLCILKKIS
jgi:DNA repair exonuclease SbcCD ATPase subunit